MSEGLDPQGYPLDPPSISGERVKALREQLGLSQAAFASLLRMPGGKQTILRWETGKTPVPGPASVGLEAIEAGWFPGDQSFGEVKNAAIRAAQRVLEAAQELVKEIDNSGRRLVE